MMSAPAAPLASVTACRRLPVPESPRLETVNVAAPAGMPATSAPSAAAPETATARLRARRLRMCFMGSTLLVEVDPTIGRARSRGGGTGFAVRFPPIPMHPPAATAATVIGNPEAFRSVYTAGFPDLLREIGATLLVSTYQSGRLIAVRADGDLLNTHFRAFASPMGIAIGTHYLALGIQRHVWEYRNQPEVSRKLDPP
ncbi:MAG TPA: hypothetical protein DD490_27210, partial [Acidobacteria bacterium]|nr:hypothetical protein [Acidobacteriota bacterium]